MPKLEITTLLLIGAITWIWFDSLRAREAGVLAVRKACEEETLQLLDETIALQSLKPGRNERGDWVLKRVYQFEFSDTGDNRRHGSVHLWGRKVVMLNIGLRLVH